ncbi:unnamed protein product [Discula destructiva]
MAKSERNSKPQVLTSLEYSVGPNGGAAGVLLVRRASHLLSSPPLEVVLHHRAGGFTDSANTWDLPGGVIDEGETPRTAAFREATEEASLPADCLSGNDPLVVVTKEVAAYNHGTWKYTVVIADVTRDWRPENVEHDWETKEVKWVPIGMVTSYNLHPDFKAQWPGLLAMIQNPAPKKLQFGKVTKPGMTGLSIVKSSAGEKRPFGEISKAPDLTSDDITKQRCDAKFTLRSNVSRIKAEAHRNGPRNRGQEST